MIELTVGYVAGLIAAVVTLGTSILKTLDILKLTRL